MAVDTTQLIRFRYGTYDEINGMGKNAQDIYFAEDKPLFYAMGKWHGIASLTSSVNADTGAITLTINGEKGYKIEHTISGAGMTTEQKEQLATAYNFVESITGTDSDDIINKWNDIVAFLAGITDTSTLSGLFNDISEQITAEATARQIADTKHTTDIKSITDLVNLMFTPEYTNGELSAVKVNAGLYSEYFISARGKDDSANGGAVDLSAVWESLTNNTDAFKDAKINIAHIPDISISKITDFPTKVSAFANDAGYINATHIANKADKATTLAGYGITDAVDLTSAQTITGVKTFSNLKVSNSNLVTNLNADMVDGFDASNIFTTHRSSSYDINTPFESKTQGSWLMRIGSTNANAPSGLADGNIVTFGHSPSDTAFQLAGAYSSDILLFRGGNYNESSSTYLFTKPWKTIAFTNSNVASAQALKHSNGAVGATVGENGNVGIGTTSPTAKLHVNGDAIITSDTTINSVLNVEGIINARGGICIGDSVYLTWDSTNKMLRVSEGLYSVGAISAGGKDTTGGSTGSGFDAERMWNELGTTSAVGIIDISHIPDITTAKITDFASQLQSALTPISEDFNALESRVTTVETHLTWIRV